MQKNSQLQFTNVIFYIIIFFFVPQDMYHVLKDKINKLNQLRYQINYSFQHLFNMFNVMKCNYSQIQNVTNVSGSNKKKKRSEKISRICLLFIQFLVGSAGRYKNLFFTIFLVTLFIIF